MNRPRLAISSFLAINLFITLGFISFSCQPTDRETKIDIPLNAVWEFRQAGSTAWLPAHVPGSVVSDLIRNKIINKPSENKIAEINKTDWEYRTFFDINSQILHHDVVNLNFKGLITYADVYLNDSLVVRANNRLRSWKVNAKPLLKAKGNLLRIYFHARPGIHPHNRSFFGMSRPYDEYSSSDQPVPAFGNGIWRPVFIQAWSIARLSDVYFYPEQITPKKAFYAADLTLESVSDQKVSVEMLLNGKPMLPSTPFNLKKGSTTEHVKFTIEKPKLWWTNGLGNPYLYTVTVRLRKDQNIIHEIHQKIGIRSIELGKQLSRDSAFFLKLNGNPLFLKGAGYVPVDRTSGEDLTEAFKEVVSNAQTANLNILRVLDRGIYEDDLFYDLCDENGILVWQDFMVHPLRFYRDSAYVDNIKEEAIENVKRLRNHPCLALWWGNDSLDVLPVRTVKGRKSSPNKAGIDNKHLVFTQLLPEICKEYSYPTPYLHLSVSKGKKTAPDIDPLNGYMAGSMVMGYGVPAFGVADEQKDTTLMSAFRSYPESKDILDYIHRNYDWPKNLNSQIYITWLAQSEIIRACIENHRRMMPFCMGTLFNQINGNTLISAAVTDVSGWWKPAQYTIRDAYSHLLVIPVRENNLVNIYVTSDALKDLDVILLVRLIDFYGKDLFVRQIPVEIKANSTGILLSAKEQEILKNADKNQCCLVVQLNQATKTLSQNILYFSAPKNLKLTKKKIDFDINESVKGYNLILRSPFLAKNVFIETIHKPCWFYDNNFDLLPGKRTKVNIKYNGSREELLKDIRIRSLVDTK